MAKKKARSSNVAKKTTPLTVDEVEHVVVFLETELAAAQRIRDIMAQAAVAPVRTTAAVAALVLDVAAAQTTLRAARRGGAPAARSLEPLESVLVELQAGLAALRPV
jgi:hypothetical protein